MKITKEVIKKETIRYKCDCCGADFNTFEGFTIKLGIISLPSCDDEVIDGKSLRMIEQMLSVVCAPDKGEEGAI